MHFMSISEKQGFGFAEVLHHFRGPSDPNPGSLEREAQDTFNLAVRKQARFAAIGGFYVGSRVAEAALLPVEFVAGVNLRCNVFPPDKRPKFPEAGILGCAARYAALGSKFIGIQVGRVAGWMSCFVAPCLGCEVGSWCQAARVMGARLGSTVGAVLATPFEAAAGVLQLALWAVVGLVGLVVALPFAAVGAFIGVCAGGGDVAFIAAQHASVYRHCAVAAEPLYS